MWSHKHNKCIRCSSTEFPHIAQGVCSKCYNKENEKKHSEHERKRKYASKNLQYEQLNDLYNKQHKSLSDIAKEYKCSRQYIYKKMQEFSIQCRDKKSARDIALRSSKISHKIVSANGTNEVQVHHKTFNEDFFSTWTPASAWVLGVIFTDGCLHKIKPPRSKKTYVRLTIEQKEPELLEKVLGLMDANNIIKRRRNNRDDFIHWIAFQNEKICSDLIEMGLTERKSLSVTFPNIPQEFYRHFIRGCWDGDGSIFLDNGRYRASFISGSESFVLTILKILVEVGIKTKYYVNSNQGTAYYYLKINGDQSCAKLFDYLYGEVDSTMYIERKYKLFQSAKREKLTIFSKYFPDI